LVASFGWSRFAGDLILAGTDRADRLVIVEALAPRIVTKLRNLAQLLAAGGFVNTWGIGFVRHGGERAHTDGKI